jgi:hypothetical protein
MKRVLYLVTAALVAMLILVPMAGAQEVTAEVERTTMVEGDLPKSGGLPVGSILAPAAALLLGGGIVAYAVARRR